MHGRRFYKLWESLLPTMGETIMRDVIDHFANWRVGQQRPRCAVYFWDSDGIAGTPLPYHLRTFKAETVLAIALGVDFQYCCPNLFENRRVGGNLVYQPLFSFPVPFGIKRKE